MVEDLHLYWVWSSVEGEGGRTIGRNRSGGRQPQPGESDSSERPSVTRGGPKVCSTRRQRLQSADVSVFFHRRAHSLRATTKKIAASTHLMILFGRRGRASGRIIVWIQAIGMIHFRWPDAHSLQSVTGSFIQIETFPNHFLCDSIASHVTDCRESPWWYLGHLDLAENAKVFAIFFHSINHVKQSVQSAESYRHWWPHGGGSTNQQPFYCQHQFFEIPSPENMQFKCIYL